MGAKRDWLWCQGCGMKVMFRNFIRGRHLPEVEDEFVERHHTRHGGKVYRIEGPNDADTYVPVTPTEQEEEAQG